MSTLVAWIMNLSVILYLITPIFGVVNYFFRYVDNSENIVIYLLVPILLILVLQLIITMMSKFGYIPKRINYIKYLLSGKVSSSITFLLVLLFVIGFVFFPSSPYEPISTGFVDKYENPVSENMFEFQLLWEFSLMSLFGLFFIQMLYRKIAARLKILTTRSKKDAA